MPKWTLIVIAALVLMTLPVAAQAKHQTGDHADRMTWSQLAKAARKEVRRGGIYSTRWGAASPWLRRLSYELVERAFVKMNGNPIWGLYIVQRESGFNPGAVNSSSRCTGLMQAAPMHWTVNGGWIDKYRMISDPAYAAKIFAKWSRGGSYTSPWSL